MRKITVILMLLVLCIVVDAQTAQTIVPLNYGSNFKNIEHVDRVKTYELSADDYYDKAVKQLVPGVALSIVSAVMFSDIKYEPIMFAERYDEWGNLISCRSIEPETYYTIAGLIGGAGCILNIVGAINLNRGIILDLHANMNSVTIKINF
jgi:hypothetical protein